MRVYFSITVGVRGCLVVDRWKVVALLLKQSECKRYSSTWIMSRRVKIKRKRWNATNHGAKRHEKHKLWRERPDRKRGNVNFPAPHKKHKHYNSTIESVALTFQKIYLFEAQPERAGSWRQPRPERPASVRYWNLWEDDQNFLWEWQWLCCAAQKLQLFLRIWNWYSE